MNSNELSATAAPCSVLSQLRSDMADVAKYKSLPFSRRYNLTDKEFIGINLRKLDDGQFHLEVSSSRGKIEGTDVKVKKLIDLAHLLVWRALSVCLSRNAFSPCPAMAHKGADEILALYSCINSFRKSLALPFVVLIDGPGDKYEMCSITQRDNIIDLALETKNIYGSNSMKWKAEFHHLNEVLERADKIIAEVLSEWVMPGGQLLRADRQSAITSAKS